MTTPAKSVSSRRVLIVAYACHPDLNMETRIGWNRAVAAAREYQATVIHSGEYSSAELASRAAELGIAPARLRFVAVPPRLARLPVLRDAVFWAGYRAWHDAALKRAKVLHANDPFQLVHLVSYCGYREPGRWWKLGVPFIWGPIGGTQNFPTSFLTQIALVPALREAIRNCVNHWQLHRSRRVREAAQQAHAIFAASAQARRDMWRGTGARCTRLLETAVSPVQPTPDRQLDTTRPFRILWSGRLREWKGLPLLLQALADLPDELKFELRVMGAGSSERRWRTLADRLGIHDHIQWIGWPPYHDGLQQYRWADAFAFTSLRDTSGTGLLESLAAGTPIIGVDHQGARDIMTPQCSIPVAVNNPQAVVMGFQRAIVRLAGDTALWRRLSAGAVQRSGYFSWERLSAQINAAYRNALQQAGGTPSQGGELRGEMHQPDWIPGSERSA